MINGNQTIGIANDPACAVVLPVELLDFSADYHAEHRTVGLSWTTTAEIDHHYFEIERSKDGEAFEPIGEVRGGANPATVQHYAFEDFALPDESGTTLYYRLKQVDFDGAMSWSETKAVALEPPADPFAAFFKENTLKVTFPPHSSGELILRNALGQITRTSRVNDASTFQMDVSNIAKGIYFVTFLSADGGQSTVKVYRG